MNILPINLEDLIHHKVVESVRLEFKATYNQVILTSCVQSICAFANDIENLNGGYIVLGVEEINGAPVLPPRGLDGLNLDEMQKEIRGQCMRIDPLYQPLLSPEVYQGKQLLVVWSPAGDTRPYQAPSARDRARTYFVRYGSETIEARGDLLTQLIQLTARTPFDDRRNLAVSADVISPSLVRNFLADIQSDLVALGSDITDAVLIRNLRITAPVNGHEAPRNVALLFFVNDPATYFPGAIIEIVQFGDDAGGDLVEEKQFRGPLQDQIRQALDYLNGFSTTMVRKIPGKAEANRTVAFPYESMEEALVNAIYHRSYDGVYEPTKVYLYPDRMDVISYPGPLPGIELSHLVNGLPIAHVPSRNRRIGEFLKELRLAEGRGTGIPKIRRKMRENGSPEPIFEFDADRTYFKVTLPAHPQYVVIHALRESAQLWAVGERTVAIENLEAALERVSTAGALIAQIIEYQAKLGNFRAAEAQFEMAEKDVGVLEKPLVYAAMAHAYLDSNDSQSAIRILNAAPQPENKDEIIDLALLEKRAGRLREAHRIFTDNYHVVKDDAKAVHEFAQTKMKLASSIGPRDARDRQTRKSLNQESVELLRRAAQLSDSPTRTGWVYFDLARVFTHLKAPENDIMQAYLRAMEICPDEDRFRDGFDYWNKHGRRHV